MEAADRLPTRMGTRTGATGLSCPGALLLACLAALLFVLSASGASAAPRSPRTHATERVKQHWQARRAVASKLQTLLPPGTRQIETLTCARPRLHGRVVKSANALDDASIWSEGRQSMLRYVHSRVPIYSGCQVHVNHRYKFIYIRQPKASSKAILKALANTLCAENVRQSANCSVTSSGTVLAHRRSISKQMWKHYFVFTVVRNPWVRQLSAYRMFTERHLRTWVVAGANGTAMPGQPCGPSLADFASNSFTMYSACTDYHCCTYNNKTQQFRINFPLVHISSQAKCAFTPQGDPLVDFIGSVEDLQVDWAQIVEGISATSGIAMKPASIVNPEAAVKNKCADAQLLKLLNEEAVRSIGLQYALDVELFGYLHGDS